MGRAKWYMSYSLVFTPWKQFARHLRVSYTEPELQVKIKNWKWFSSGGKTEQKPPRCERWTPQLWAGSNSSIYWMKFIRGYLLFPCYWRRNSTAWTVLPEGFQFPSLSGRGGDAVACISTRNTLLREFSTSFYFVCLCGILNKTQKLLKGLICMCRSKAK